METALRLNTTVLPGHCVEVIALELLEGTRVELIVTDLSTTPFQRYPSALEAEYNALIDKKLNRTLTVAEDCRLQDVRNVIAEIDRLTLANDSRTERLNDVETKLAKIRAEIDALPDA